MEKWMGTNALYYPKPKISQHTIKHCCQGSNYSDTRFQMVLFQINTVVEHTVCIAFIPDMNTFHLCIDSGHVKETTEFKFGNETVLFTFTNVISCNHTEMKLFSFQ